MTSKASTAAIRFHSTQPSSSALLESDIEGLQQKPFPPPTSESFPSENSIPDWFRPSLWFCRSRFGDRPRGQPIGSPRRGWDGDRGRMAEALSDNPPDQYFTLQHGAIV